LIVVVFLVDSPPSPLTSITSACQVLRCRVG
jgi:hypothetical protein